MTKSKQERKLKAQADNSVAEMQKMIHQNRDVLSDMAKYFCDFNTRLEALECEIEVLKSEKSDSFTAISSQCDDIHHRFDHVSSMMEEYMTSQQSTPPITRSETEDESHVISPTNGLCTRNNVEEEEDNIRERVKQLETSVKNLTDSATSQTAIASEKTAAQKFKAQNQVLWSDSMNSRKKCYWKFVQNDRKSALYERWTEESPQFLPLKYRPRANSTDSPVLIEQKIGQSHRKYRDDITLMKAYAEQHIVRTKKLDKVIQEEALGKDLGENVIREIKILWEEEAQKNELISLQLWKKRESFLIKKKKEEADTTAQECIFDPWYRQPIKWKSNNIYRADSCNNWRQ